ncbi:SPFH domain-containing protein [Sorangium sp. So ce327]|uniref:SPFH domain-containing protein n=1 Tax=Sorangium sp. So ce327 TaxID=3133301 RepID=UPI003F5D6E30
MSLILAVLGLFTALYLLSGLRQINQWEAALRFTLGKLTGRVSPGVTLFLPGIQELRRIDTRMKNRDLLQQMVITRDNVTTMVDAVVYYRVVDPEKATLAVENYENAMKDRAKVVLRDVVGETRLDELLAHREEVAAKVRAQVEAVAAAWGLHVEMIGLQDIALPPQMQEVLAKGAIAERDRRYVVIKSEADVESAKNFAEAAGILARSPGAMELRRFEALANLSQGNTKVIFDLAKPYDDVRHAAVAMAEAAATEAKPARVQQGQRAVDAEAQREAEAALEEAALEEQRTARRGRMGGA